MPYEIVKMPGSTVDVLETKCVGSCQHIYRIDELHPEYAKVKEALERGDRSVITCYHRRPVS
jgi:hypothetical protein